MLRSFLTRIKGVPCVPLSLEIGNTLSQIFVGYAIGCMFVFPRLGMLREVKRVVTFPKIYRVDPGSSIKVLASKIKKSVFSQVPLQGMLSPVPSKNASIRAAAPASPHKRF